MAKRRKAGAKRQKGSKELPRAPGTVQPRTATERSQADVPFDRRRLCIALGLLFAVVVVFSQVGGFEFIVGDDVELTVASPWGSFGQSGEHVHNSGFSLPAITRQPITWVSHRIDFRQYGQQPRGHHLTSVVIHAANSVLLFFALCRLTCSRESPAGSVWRSGFVSAPFAIHPLQAEPVAWVSARQEVLSTFFALLMVWAYARYAERPTGARYAAVAVFFAPGLLSSTLPVTMPLILLLLDYWPLGRMAHDGNSGTSVKRAIGWRVVEKLPLIALALAASLVNYWARYEPTVAAGRSVPCA